MAKPIYASQIDKDVRRILGKKICLQCEHKNGGWLFAERSNGDIEYHLNNIASLKLKEYMRKHRKSRLYRSWTGDAGLNCRFEVDGYGL